MDPDKPTILVDDRERSSGIVELLDGLSTTPLVYRHQPIRRDTRFQQIHILVGISGVGAVHAERITAHLQAGRQRFSDRE